MHNKIRIHSNFYLGITVPQAAAACYDYLMVVKYWNLPAMTLPNVGTIAHYYGGCKCPTLRGFKSNTSLLSCILGMPDKSRNVKGVGAPRGAGGPPPILTMPYSGNDRSKAMGFILKIVHRDCGCLDLYHDLGSQQEELWSWYAVRLCHIPYFRKTIGHSGKSLICQWNCKLKNKEHT